MCTSGVVVSLPPVTVSCVPSATTATTGIPVTWTATPAGGDGNYTYSWS